MNEYETDIKNILTRKYQHWVFNTDYFSQHFITFILDPEDARVSELSKYILLVECGHPHWTAKDREGMNRAQWLRGLNLPRGLWRTGCRSCWGRLSRQTRPWKTEHKDNKGMKKPVDWEWQCLCLAGANGKRCVCVRVEWWRWKESRVLVASIICWSP
jgi:hypothetical protein